MRLRLFLLVLAALLPLRALADTCGPGGDHDPITTSNGITFQLQGLETCGQYVDGNFWVIDDGDVKVTAMTPAYTGPNGENGYQVNPEGCRTTSACGNDEADKISVSRNYYNRNSTVREWAEPPSLPLALSSGDSLLKMVSHPGGCARYGGQGTRASCMLKAAVLTVVNSDPTSGCASGRAFRPPYAGPDKNNPADKCSPTDAWIDANLPTLSDVPNQISWAQAEAYLGDGVTPLADLGEGNRGMEMWADDALLEDNMYGAKFALWTYIPMNRLLQSGTASQKRYTLERLAQFGIDKHAMVQVGQDHYGDGAIHVGRKALVVFAYFVTGESDYFNPTRKGGTGWHENAMIWDPDGPGESFEALWGDTPEYDGTPACSDGCGANNSTGRHLSGDRDGGCSVYGTRPETICDVQPTIDVQRSSGQYSMGAYQGMSHAQGLGVIAVLRQLGLESAWAYEPFFDYHDRILGPPWNGACPGGYCDSYLADMAEAYSEADPNFSVSMGCVPSSGDEPLDSICTAQWNNEQGSVTCDWDTDDDGSYDDVLDTNPINLTDLTQGSYPIAVECTDDGPEPDDTDTDATSVTVNAPGASPTIEGLYLIQDDEATDINLGEITQGSSWEIANKVVGVWVKANDEATSVCMHWTGPGASEIPNVREESTQPYAFTAEFGWITAGVLPDIGIGASGFDNDSDGTHDMSEIGQHTLRVVPCDIEISSGGGCDCPAPNQGDELSRTWTFTDQTQQNPPGMILEAPTLLHPDDFTNALMKEYDHALCGLGPVFPALC